MVNANLSMFQPTENSIVKANQKSLMRSGPLSPKTPIEKATDISINIKTPEHVQSTVIQVSLVGMLQKALYIKVAAIIGVIINHSILNGNGIFLNFQITNEARIRFNKINTTVDGSGFS